MNTETVQEPERRPERNWDEIASKYEKVDLDEAKALANRYAEIFLTFPEVQKALELIRDELNAKYSKFKFPEQEDEPQPGMKLPYHNVEHTEDVFRTAIYLAVVQPLADGVEINEKELLQIGLMAIYHDTGFIEQYQKNEDLGATIATIILNDCGYRAESMKEIADGIQATKVDLLHGFRQNVTALSPLAYRILCDADVRNFGGADHEAASLKFSREFNTMNKSPVPTPGTLEMEQNYKVRLMMLNDHRWNSDVAYFLFEPQKKKNMEYLENQLKALR